MNSSMEQGLRASMHFPIEGKSPWVMILRATALGGVGTMAVMAALVSTLDVGGDMKMVLAGIAAFLLMEYFIMRLVVVPRMADYGRFRVYQHKVDFYPMDFFGLKITDASDSEPISSFSGLAVKADAEGRSYRVMLLHKEQRGRHICVKAYNAPQPANSHAEALAQTMGIGYVPFKPGAARGAKKAA